MIVSPLGFFNLILLIVSLVLVLLGYYEKRFKMRIILHATIMTSALILTLVSVLLIMVPSFTISIGLIVAAMDWRFPYLLLHHLIGLAALGMASLLAGSWLLSGRRPNGCLGRPENKLLIMRMTFTLWIISLVMGIVLYLLFL